MSSKKSSTKRDRVRELLSRFPKDSSRASPKVHPSTSATLADGDVQLASLSLSPYLSDELSNEFWMAVVTKLGSEDRLLIQQYIAVGATDAIEAAYVAACKQQEVYKSKKWSKSGKTNRVILWLDRFKSVGDVAANADPVHVGLPWAGIRLLLEAAVTDHHQMTALMNGMDVALCTANRLRAYFTYYRHLPAAPTTEILQKSLIALYVHLLQFLATAVRTFSMSTAARKFEALWRTTDLVAFEERCDKLGGRVDTAANNCDRELHTQERADASRWKESLAVTLHELDAIRSIPESVDALRVKIDLSKLTTIREATYNSSAEERLSQCLEGTRLTILQEILQWRENSQGPLMFWLCGSAGTGKSTISRTVAQRFDEQQFLGASFFFKRGEKNRSNADQFFSTIAAQLADFLPGMRVSVAAALDKDSFLCGRGLQEQFEKLLLYPLLSITPTDLKDVNIAIVIDALDECDPNTDVQTFLRLLARLGAETALRLRIFLTSRPELPVQLGFKRLDRTLYQDIILEEVQEQSISQDIRTYLENEFTKIKQDRLLLQPDDTLPADWPSDDDIQLLVTLSVPLFIFASTVCRFVSGSNPQRRLKAILEQRYSAGSSHLAKTYSPILQQLLLEKDKEEQLEVLSIFRKAVGSIVLLADPLSVSSLVSLLHIEQEDIVDILRQLHSVLQVPSSLHDPVRLLHQSFRDFLIDQATKHKDVFWVDDLETHKQLSDHCLRQLQEPNVLKNDICDVRQPGFRRTDLAMQQVTTRISADVAYACSYWSWHLVESREKLCDDGQVHHFLRKYFLNWLEALSWIGRLSSAIICVDGLLSIATGEDGRDVAAFLIDAKQFILGNRLVMELAPLQTYHSALIFSPKDSVIRNVFETELLGLWSLLPNVPSRWGAEILRFEGHDATIITIAFSPDNRVVASVSEDDTLRLWDAQSGEEKHRFAIGRSPAPMPALMFSADGRIVTLASSGNGSEIVETRVQAWDAQTGEEMQRLKVLGYGSRAIAFSPDAQTLAVSIGWTLQLWNTQTGEQLQEFRGHTDEITVIAFSPDGRVVASASYDNTVRLWDIQYNNKTQQLEGHDKHVTAVAFSLDGRLAASASGDRTVKVWNPKLGEEVSRLQGHDGEVSAIAFSPDGNSIASATHKTIRLWSTHTSEQIQRLKIDRRAAALNFSPNGQLLAVKTSSALLLWDVQTAQCTRAQRPQKFQHGKMILTTSFAPDGHLIAYTTAAGKLYLVNIQTGRGLQTHEINAFSYLGNATVTFSPDSQTVAVAYPAFNNCEIKIWKVQNGELIQSLRSPEVLLPQNYTGIFDYHDLIKASFEDRKRLRTAFGTYILQWNPDGSLMEPLQRTTELELVDQWIRYQGQDLLYLPLDYRGKCAKIHGDMLMIGQASGAVSFFRVKQSTEPDADAA